MNRDNSKIYSLIEYGFPKLIFIGALVTLIIVGAIFVTLLISSSEAIETIGFSFFYDTIWDPVTDQYGALAFLAGTLITSILALIISTPFSLSIAIFLGEYFKEGKVSTVLKSLVELLAGIPSVIYGFWGIFFLVPIVRSLAMQAGAIPYGVGVLTASLILAFMIIPYSASIAREVITLTPSDIKEAAYSLGSTRYEVIKNIVIPYSRSGIFAGVLLALGRALGETMAVTMLIGNVNQIPDSLFSPANTMASVIANEFAEATGDLYLSTLIMVGLLLFLVTMLFNILGKKLISRFSYE